jgi:hypothetical protein
MFICTDCHCGEIISMYLILGAVEVGQLFVSYNISAEMIYISANTQTSRVLFDFYGTD